MPDGASIVLPNNWKPRSYQQKLWDYLANGGKRAVAVWHRRAGKDEVCLHHSACAAMERVGVYWHMLPQADQARKAIWDAVNPNTGKRRIDEAFPEDIRATTRETDMFIRFVNGSTWQVVGSDNFNSLVGTPPVGIVLSEWALADPNAWAYLSPILRDNGGWALFIFTPRGRNHAYKTLLTARKNADWFAETLTVEETKRFTKEDLDEERQTLVDIYGEDDGMNKYEQEYNCSFDAAILGAYFTRELSRAEKEGRITSVPYISDLPVITAWDIGRSDATAIWFVQQAMGGGVRIIDYYRNVGKDVTHYCDVIKARGYSYSEHIWPHDGGKGDWSTAKTRPQIASAHGVSPRILNQEQDVTDGINAARRLMSRCWFDAEKCADGLEALRSYHKEWDDKNRVFKDKPKHDWASDPADAFRYLARGLPDQTFMPEKRDRYSRQRSGGSGHGWMGNI
jgi:phage terminase large subunit